VFEQQGGAVVPVAPDGGAVGSLASAEPGHPHAMVPVPSGLSARHVLVWPEPDGTVAQALQVRGYRPVLVRSREDVTAQVKMDPAALFVDLVTGPITRSTLRSLRDAAGAARIPVLVTAGVGVVARDAGYTSDPTTLFGAFATADSDQHAPRVLLVEGNADVMGAMATSLERRGIQAVPAASESEAVSRAASCQPNLVVIGLDLIRRRRVGIVDWLRNHDRLSTTPIVVYTPLTLDPESLSMLRTGETVLYVGARSTHDEVRRRVVDILGKVCLPSPAH
jgi:ActR/RegA family two-component response regulator